MVNRAVFLSLVVMAVVVFIFGCSGKTGNNQRFPGNLFGWRGNDVTDDRIFTNPSDENVFKIVTGSSNAFQSIRRFKNGYVLAGVSGQREKSFLTVILTDNNLVHKKEMNIEGINFITYNWSGFKDIEVFSGSESIWIAGLFNSGDSTDHHRAFIIQLDGNLEIRYSKLLDTAFTVDAVNFFAKGSNRYLIHDAAYSDSIGGFLLNSLNSSGNIIKTVNIDPSESVFLSDVFFLDDAIYASARSAIDSTVSFFYRVSYSGKLLWKLSLDIQSVVTTAYRAKDGVIVTTVDGMILKIDNSGKLRSSLKVIAHSDDLLKDFGVGTINNLLSYYRISYSSRNQQRTILETGFINDDLSVSKSSYLNIPAKLSFVNLFIDRNLYFLIGTIDLSNNSVDNATDLEQYYGCSYLLKATLDSNVQKPPKLEKVEFEIEKVGFSMEAVITLTTKDLPYKTINNVTVISNGFPSSSDIKHNLIENINGNL